MIVYGYCRISQPKQNIFRQIRNIKEVYPNARIVEEAYTGRKKERKKWRSLFDRVRPGDTIVFDSVSRMSRNAEDGFSEYEELYQRGVRLVFLKEPHINTDVYKNALQGTVGLTGGSVDYIIEGLNNYLMALAKEQIRLAFEQSEKEVEDLRQRTREGLETARLNGKQVGREKGQTFETKKAKETKKLIRKHAREFGGSLMDVDVMKLAGVTKASYYKYKREMKEAAE